MAYAAESSKRKFHRMLESISNNVATSAATREAHDGPSSTAVGQPPSKRVRLANSHREGAGLATALARNGTLTTLRAITTPGSAVNLTTRKMATTRLGDEVSPYAPTMRAEFLLRLKTFIIKALEKWGDKPDNINEVEWAKRGWALEEKETVRCTYCSHRHIIKYEEQAASIQDDDALPYEDQVRLREEAQAAIAAKWAPLIIDGHSESCPWRARGCDATIYRIPVNHPAYAIPQLKARYESVLTMHAKLPDVEVPDNAPLDHLYEEFELCVYGKDGEVYPDEEIPERTPYETRRLAFAFALFGWEVDPEQRLPDKGIVMCKACWRRLGLWLFSQFKNNDLEELLAVAKEHRDYCPWKNGTTQNQGAAAFNYYEEEDTPAWQQLARYVEKAGKSRRLGVDFAALDANPETAVADGHNSVAGSDASDLVHKERPDALERMAETRAAEALAAETQAAEDRDRLNRWQRLKQKLAIKPKKRAAQD